jgi:hypothetical protein
MSSSDLRSSDDPRLARRDLTEANAETVLIDMIHELLAQTLEWRIFVSHFGQFCRTERGVGFEPTQAFLGAMKHQHPKKEPRTEYDELDFASLASSASDATYEWIEGRLSLLATRVIAQLQSKREVTWQSVCRFIPKVYEAYQGRDPASGQAVDVPERIGVLVRADAALIARRS